MGSLEDQLEELRLTTAAPSSSFDAPFSPFSAFSGFPSPIKSPFQTLTTTTPTTHATPSAAFSGLSGGIDIPSIPRRFTADAGKLPWGGAFSGSHQRASIAALPDLSSMFGGLSSQTSSTTTLRKSQLYEKKLQHMEQMREQRRQLEVDMKMFDLQQEREQQELNQLARDLAQAQVQAQTQAGQNRLPRSGSVQYPIQPGGHHQRNLSQVTQGQPLDESSASSALSSTSTSAFSSGHVSQPTTPPMQQKESSPEDGSRGFPSSFARPARFSTSSVNSNGWFYPFGSPPQQRDLKDLKPLPKIGSAPGSAMASRRNSEDEHFAPGTSLDQRQVPGASRYSLPASSFPPKLQTSVNGGSSFPSALGFGSFQHAKHLHNGDIDNEGPGRISTPEVNSYLKMTDPDEKPFPTLKSDRRSGLLSVNSTALEIANAPTPVPTSEQPQPVHRPTTYTHGRAYHQSISLPPNSLNYLGMENDNERNGIANGTRPLSTQSLQFSYDPFTAEQQSAAPGHLSIPQPAIGTARRSRAQTMGGTPMTPPRDGRESVQIGSPTNGGFGFGNIPFSPERNDRRQSAAVFGNSPGSPIPPRKTGDGSMPQSLSSSLQSSTVPFGAAIPAFATAGAASAPAGLTPAVMQTLQLQQQQQQQQQAAQQQQSPTFSFGMQMPAFQPGAPQLPYRGRPQHAPRRSEAGDATQGQRFSNNVPLEQHVGEIYSLCKDQHGCRYLQRKLEEKNPAAVQMVFAETYMHVVELMTDPFGNYLCQKLLEFSNDEQRTALIDNAAPQLVSIALNQHGTRALQKMIEFISTPGQTQTVIEALRHRVVELVKDLNGNHVIQKCLNRLPAEEARFIYEAVGENCVEVGTHRHGCCVLQRCIDHASGKQKARLIEQITENAFTLVQDPFGNYVVQYILDLQEPHFIEPVCRKFAGRIPFLSKQKFSSNVIEKCIRTADQNSCRNMIGEMIAGNELERMLRDSFANYVVQTAIEYADPETRAKLLDGIRPILPTIRATPHGRRIANKMMSLEPQHRQSLSNGSNGAGNANANGLSAGKAPMSNGGVFQHDNMQSQRRQPMGGFAYASPPPPIPTFGFGDMPSSLSSEAPSAFTAQSITTPSNTSLSSAGGSPRSGPLSVNGIYSPVPVQGASGLNGLPGAAFLYSRS